MNTLDEIAAIYGTDKSTEKVATESAKGYAPNYARYLEPVRDKPITLLEIGIMDGKSLRMWEDYLPNARIYAIDRNPRCQGFESERSQVFIGDQTNTTFLQKVVDAIGGPIDCVIDDGGHRMEHHQASLLFLWPHVRPGGWYAIEDLHTCYSEKFGGGYKKPESTMERVLKPMLDRLNSKDVDPPFVNGVEAVHFFRKLAFLFKETARKSVAH